MAYNQYDRLSPEQFRAIIIGKGWTYKELAAYWNITTVWLGVLTKNVERPVHYDDAVIGLPTKRYFGRSMKRRLMSADAYVASTGGKKVRRSYVNRYQGELGLGAIVGVMEDVGSMAVVGDRGCVFGVRKIDGVEQYGVVFENGEHDWFSADFIDAYLVLTGLIDPSMHDYVYVSAEALEEDFKAQRFRFSI